MASGDFGMIGTTLQIVGESLCETVDLRSGSQVLDVAAGNGNCLARRGAPFCVMSSPPTTCPRCSSTVNAGRSASGLSIQFQEADAEALPFADSSFDVVLSSFGVMFAPNHERAALELAARLPARRTHRPGELDAGGFIGRSSASSAGTSRHRPR